MRNPTAAAALITLFALGACRQEPTGPQASCSGAPVVQAQGTIFVATGPAAASDAGAVYAVVTRERSDACNDVIVTVTDSAAIDNDPAASQPWVDGDATGLKSGTPLYVRVGTQPGEELVAERSPGEWVLLAVFPKN